MKKIVLATVIGSWTGFSGLALACADSGSHERVLEVAVDVGLLDRATTGIGPPLLGAGYEQSAGPVAGVGSRLLFPIGDSEFFHHGAALRLSHNAGAAFGLNDRYGFAWTSVDVGYAFRTALPCLSTPERAWTLTGIVGLTGVDADAGTGTGDDAQTAAERRAASRELDHVGLGPMVAVGLDLHAGPILVGLSFDLREVFALGDGPVSRSYVETAALRVGALLEP